MPKQLKEHSAAAKSKTPKSAKITKVTRSKKTTSKSKKPHKAAIQILEENDTVSALLQTCMTSAALEQLVTPTKTSSPDKIRNTVPKAQKAVSTSTITIKQKEAVNTYYAYVLPSGTTKIMKSSVVPEGARLSHTINYF